MGYGLWPDVQLRLHHPPARDGLTGRIHERLTGSPADVELLPDLPILHRQRLTKTADGLRAKLALFDAAGGRDLHRLLGRLPALPLSFFPEPARVPARPRPSACPGRPAATPRSRPRTLI